ncbi:MAG: ferritin-like domain-containing protein [Myxococcota bacterium]|nr:ferritin-like domain-containing protein [Myxococcota bacterium]
MKSPKEKLTDKIAEKHVNRTGIALSPKLSKELLDSTRDAVPSSKGDESAIAKLRASYASEADPIGSIPPPATMKGAAKSAMKAIKGEHASVLLDKVGERLAFERTGTRLYETLISKLQSSEERIAGGPTLARLQQFHREEAQHFAMLKEAMEALGGDPTAVTPSADVAAVLSMGVGKILQDPRTTFRQCLEAILLAELADHDGWTMLIDLARTMGQDELASRFETALLEEEVHLRDVREWVSLGVLGKAGVESKTKTKATHATR